METYQTEEQQVEAIKAFWDKHGNSVIGGIVIGIGGFVGFNMYQDNKLAGEQALSDKYEEIQKISALNEDTYVAQGEKFIADNAGTSYAALTAFNLSKIAAEKQDWAKAETLLKQAAEKSPTAELKAIANERLARVQIQLEKYDEAITLLNSAFPESFTATIEEIKGDAYIRQGKTDLARNAYQAAVEASGDSPSAALQMKLDDLAQQVNL